MSVYDEYTVKVVTHGRNKGHQVWYLNGKLHCSNGPAIIYADGSTQYYIDGQLHREDGPAIEWASGIKRWFLQDVEYSEEDFNNHTNPAQELTLGEIEKLLGHPVKIIKEYN